MRETAPMYREEIAAAEAKLAAEAKIAENERIAAQALQGRARVQRMMVMGVLGIIGIVASIIYALYKARQAFDSLAYSTRKLGRQSRWIALYDGITSLDAQLCMTELFLVLWCLYVYRGIVRDNLDFSLDPPRLYALSTSRLHTALGVAVGSIMLRVGVWPTRVALALFVAYTLRNFKHLRSLRVRFAAQHRARPSVWRSSMVRQQMQLHIGIGLGGLLHQLRALWRDPALTHSLPSTAVLNWEWLGLQSDPRTMLFALCGISLYIGVVQLAQDPIPAEEKRAFVERWAGGSGLLAGQHDTDKKNE